jgi:hypothetical protein
LYTVGETATTLSPLSNICSIYKNPEEGYSPEASSSKAAKIDFSNLSNKFERIQIFRINYVVLGQAPSIHMVYDGPVVSSFIDRGSNIEQLGDSELLGKINLGLIPKIIESKEDYMFAANVKYK